MKNTRKSVALILLLVTVVFGSLHSFAKNGNTILVIRRADMFQGLFDIIKNYSSLSILQEESSDISIENIVVPDQTEPSSEPTILPVASPTPKATIEPTPMATATPTPTPTSTPTPTPAPEDYNQTTILVYFHDEDVAKRMDIESYVLGVLAAEMSDSYDLDALKAQAIAIRTQCYYSLENEKKHDFDADICTNSAHCQSFSLEDYSDKYIKAVKSTSGLVMKYKGEIISANYFCCSSGYTENASDVWGGSDKPYLKSVISPGEEKFDYYYKKYEFTQERFAKKLGVKGAAFENITDIKRSAGGGILSVTINGKEFSGRDLREELGIRASAAYFSQGEDGNIIVEVYGYGHGVGMSQCGAQVMAENGASYKEILNHYYTDIKIRDIY